VSKLRDLKPELLEEGVDLVISEADWDRIREHLPVDGPPPAEDLLVLLEMRGEARAVCPEFDEYFFPAFKAHLLADGTISKLEQFQLLRMLYGGGGIDAAEREFLRELRAELGTVEPEFEALYNQAMRD
jgi:hypothetical protein